MAPSGDTAISTFSTNVKNRPGGGGIGNVIERGGAGSGVRCQAPRVMSRATAAAATTHGAQRTAARDRGDGGGAWRSGSAIDCSRSTASWADCQRSPGSFARHPWTSRSNAAGAAGCSEDTAGGSVVMIAEAIAAGLSPANARRPVAISNRVAPNAKRSLRASAGRPSNCSGAMYWMVPRMLPFGGQVLSNEGGRIHATALHQGRDRFREPEIEQLGAGGRQHHVAGFEIAVDDAAAMRGIEGARDAGRERDRLSERQRPFGQA